MSSYLADNRRGFATITVGGRLLSDQFIFQAPETPDTKECADYDADDQNGCTGAKPVRVLVLSLTHLRPL